jgi:hypothetical protein
LAPRLRDNESHLLAPASRKPMNTGQANFFYVLAGAGT